MHLSSRIQKLNVSGIRRVFDLAQKLENPINFSIGQPDFHVPESILNACTQATLQHQNSYTPTQGRPDLLEALRCEQNSRGLKFEDLMVTSGVSGGLFLAFNALLDAGDEIILPDPYFLMYEQLALLLDAKAVYADTAPDFNVTAERLEKLISPKTKAIVLNFPANPTGKIPSLVQMTELMDLLARHPQITVISDEIYRHFTYDQPYFSPAEKLDNILTLDGFSKSHAMTGWRLGWASGPKAIIQQMAKLQQFTFVCAPANNQVAAIQALTVDMSEYISAYRIKRDLVFNALKTHYEIVKPDGSFYAYPKIPDAYANSDLFVDACLKYKLMVIPGNIFSQKNDHFRLSFATSNEKLKEGCDILIKLAGG